MFLQAILITAIQALNPNHAISQGQGDKSFHDEVYLEKKVISKPWGKNEDGPTYLLITADPLALKLILHYSDATILTMQTLAKLIEATVLDLRRFPGDKDEEISFQNTISELRRIVAGFEYGHSPEEIEKTKDAIKRIRMYSVEPTWVIPPKGLEKIRGETRNAWKHFSMLIESMWGSLLNGDQGWFVAQALDDDLFRSAKGGGIFRGRKRALLPRIGDALHFYCPENPLPEWGGRPAFGRNGVLVSPRVLMRNLQELSRHILESELGIQMKHNASRFSLWDLLLKMLDDPEVNYIRRRLRKFILSKLAIDKVLGARIQSVLGLAVIMRYAASYSLVIGRVTGKIKTPYALYYLLLISREVEESFVDAVESLKQSIKLGRKVVSVLKRVGGPRFELEELSEDWRNMDSSVASFEGYIRLIGEMRKHNREGQWSRVKDGSKLWNCIDSLSLFSFLHRSGFNSSLAIDRIGGCADCVIPRGSWLRAHYRVDSIPHSFTVRFLHNGKPAYGRSAVPLVELKTSGGDHKTLWEIWEWDKN